MHGRNYGMYKQLNNMTVHYNGFTLTFDHVQSDPYASPTRAHLNIASSGFPSRLFTSKIRRVAAADFLTRQFWNCIHQAGGDQGAPAGGRGGYGGVKGGSINIDKPGQHVLPRTSVLVNEQGSLEARFTLSMPAKGRSIQGHTADTILLQTLPSAVQQIFFGHSSFYTQQNGLAMFEQHVDSVEDQEELRRLMVQAGYIAFVRDGAILPRSSGNVDVPLTTSSVVPFQSPNNLRHSFVLPHLGEIFGMCIPTGVTLICGGGFHGKSTLLKALELGVYNKVPGDGREFVCTEPTSVKIRAEDGRYIDSVNITPFINNLPGGRSTACFQTLDASGSTSQAAAIVEAMEMGTRVLLIDEDTAATNFMIRDRGMCKLVEHDPITPYVEKVRSLLDRDVSSILVIGGCSDYFKVADLVICMENYVPFDKTARAKEISNEMSREISGLEEMDNGPFTGTGSGKGDQPFGTVAPRAIVKGCLNTNNGKIVARRLDCLQFDNIDVDLSGVEQLVEVSQVRAIGNILR